MKDNIKDDAVKIEKAMPGTGRVTANRLTVWRRERVVTRIYKPTKIKRARTLGYKAKQGFVVARVRVKRGRIKSQKITGGRRPKRSGRFHSLGKSWQVVAEEKAGRKFRNLEVLNSYWAGQDGKSRWYEVIMVDPSHPAVKKDSDIRWIAGSHHRGRAQRGLTSSGKKSRGLR